MLNTRIATGSPCRSVAVRDETAGKLLAVSYRLPCDENHWTPGELVIRASAAVSGIRIETIVSSPPARIAQRAQLTPRMPPSILRLRSRIQPPTRIGAMPSSNAKPDIDRIVVKAVSGLKDHSDSRTTDMTPSNEASPAAISTDRGSESAA